jgi:hypothetical protein
MKKTDLARMLGISTRTVDRLEGERVFIRDAGGYVLEACVTNYCAYIRRDEATRQARRDLLRAQTVDRRLGTRAKLSRMATGEELQELLTDIWLTHLDAWRQVASAFYYGLTHQAIPELRARGVAGGFEAEAVGWLSRARDEMAEKLQTVMARVAEPDRVEELLKQLEAEAITVGEE